MLDLKHPAQSYIRCAGSLGWGLPAALGAKCAAPGRPVLCFTGDGGIWYHIAEIETAVKENLNVVILVNNNHSLNQEKNGVESYAGQSPASDKQWLFPDADFAAIAESMGADGPDGGQAGRPAGRAGQGILGEPPGGHGRQEPRRRHRAAGLAARVGRGGVGPDVGHRGCVARLAGMGS